MAFLLFFVINTQIVSQYLGYVTPEWVSVYEDLGKLAVGIISIVGVYALVESRQRKVIKTIIKDEIGPPLSKIEEEVSELEHRTSLLEGAEYERNSQRHHGRDF